MRRLSTTYKITLLLALLSTAPLVFLVFNRSTENIRQVATQRTAACEQLALASAFSLLNKDRNAVEQQIGLFIDRNAEVGAVRIVRFDGLVLSENGEKDLVWDSNLTNSAKQIRVPILRNNQVWGRVETIYKNDPNKDEIRAIVKAFVSTVSLNLLTFGILLRRALSTLDTKNAVPRRVRNTLDTIVGGVVIMDPNGNIVMANEAFQASCGKKSDQLVGNALAKIPFRSEDSMLPWEKVNVTRERESGSTLFLSDAAGNERCFVVNATPVFGAKEEIAGTLISFEDITTLEQQKQSLMSALTELETSKEQIHQQNVRLQELASMDALTGTFNRRSLFEQLDELWNQSIASETHLNVIMLDVDHFKNLNDTHGHAVGDQVLRDVSATIKSTVSTAGIVGRYGGEEFCIVISDATPEKATAVAEKVRYAIETQLAEPYRVTASFGVSSSQFKQASFQEMLEQADEALYAAKDGGRNAVCCWWPGLSCETEEKQAAEAISLDRSRQPISYHAVASLHTALAYRDADTALHSQRVAEMSVALGRGLLSVSDLYVLEIGGILHDIGKIGVPDNVLRKPGKLTVEEWRIMAAHSQMGVEIVDASFNSKTLSDLIRFHHYRFDGVGTPEGEPVGEELSLGARIICIVDAYDAMVSNRVYRAGRTPEEAFSELKRCAGTQFDPELVDRFIKLQIGWRPDSRHVKSGIEDELALSVGHFTERTMAAFDAKDKDLICDSLKRLERTARKFDLLPIQRLSSQLREIMSAARAKEDWETAVPIVQDLLDMCLTLQRAHIRDVASRPQVTQDCPQQDYYAKAREWDFETYGK